MFHPYSDDMDILIKHCIENEMRGGMLLIERGMAAQKIKASLEQKSNGTLSIKALVWELKERGWAVNDKSLSFALYAAENLSTVIPTVLWQGAGRPFIQKLKQTIEDCQSYWIALEDVKVNPSEAEEEFTLIWQEALREVDSEELTPEQARDAIEGAMADYLGCPVMTLRGDIQAMSEGLAVAVRVPKSVLTGQLPDLTVKPEKSDAKPNGQSTATRTGTGTTGGSESRQEAAKSSVQETAARNQEAARTITRKLQSPVTPFLRRLLGMPTIGRRRNPLRQSPVWKTLTIPPPVAALRRFRRRFW